MQTCQLFANRLKQLFIIDTLINNLTFDMLFF